MRRRLQEAPRPNDGPLLQGGEEHNDQMAQQTVRVGRAGGVQAWQNANRQAGEEVGQGHGQGHR